jgi:hypothetical protein
MLCVKHIFFFFFFVKLENKLLIAIRIIFVKKNLIYYRRIITHEKNKTPMKR